jgi:hypothetical protein
MPGVLAPMFHVEESDRISLVYERLALRLPTDRPLLHNVTGRFDHSQLHAVMGEHSVCNYT